MVVGREKRHHGAFISLHNPPQAERRRGGSPPICGLNDCASSGNSREFLPIKRFVNASQGKESSSLLEHRRNAFARLGEKALTLKEPTELFGARIARDPMGQFP